MCRVCFDYSYIFSPSPVNRERVLYVVIEQLTICLVKYYKYILRTCYSPVNHSIGIIMFLDTCRGMKKAYVSTSVARNLHTFPNYTLFN